MTASEGVTRIETIGAVVRGDTGALSRIAGVIESSRLSPDHVSCPLDVVVTLEQVGPGYNHRSAWASALAPAQEGDRGSHPHERDCECGEPYDDSRGGFYYHVPQSW